jgi:hypothetical protein
VTDLRFLLSRCGKKSQLFGFDDGEEVMMLEAAATSR